MWHLGEDDVDQKRGGEEEGPYAVGCMHRL